MKCFGARPWAPRYTPWRNSTIVIPMAAAKGYYYSPSRKVGNGQRWPRVSPIELNKPPHAKRFYNHMTMAMSNGAHCQTRHYLSYVECSYLGILVAFKPDRFASRASLQSGQSGTRDNQSEMHCHQAFYPSFTQYRCA